MEVRMQRYKVLDENGTVLGSGPTEEAAIAAAAAKMAAGIKQHCAQMGNYAARRYRKLPSK